MNSLRHNGVLVPPRYVGRGLTIRVRGEAVKLNDEQEEMAVAWAKKAGTPYVEDPVFKENFHRDFSEKLGTNVMPGDVDYSEVLRVVEHEREIKANLPAEERKKQVIERKVLREANKEKYGWATVDGERIEVGNYTVEPNSIFMGRGQHPKRGSWKEGPREENIELNLSPDPDADETKAELGALGFRVVWDPNSIWIARWKDKLSGKMKYVWPSDASFLKQRKDIEKFEKAEQLKGKLDAIKAHIESNLTAEDLKRRRTATVCYLIDHLKFRVGDEKDDEDEADTVGASTLRPEHVCFNGDGTVTFDFLGKDSVRNVIEAKLPDEVIKNLNEFSYIAQSFRETKLKELKIKIKESEEKTQNKKIKSEESIKKRIKAKEESIKKRYKRLEDYQRQLSERKAKRTPVKFVEQHIKLHQEFIKKQEQNIQKLNTIKSEQSKKIKEQLEKLEQQNMEKIKRLQMELEDKKPTLFDGVDSSIVNSFLDEVMTGLSAKVFRTFYATSTVEKRLRETKVNVQDPDYVKHQVALRANLEAAIVCNHKRTVPKTWAQSLQKKKDRLKQLKEKASADEKVARQKILDEEWKYRERLKAAEEKLVEVEKKRETARAQLEEAERQGKDQKRLRKRLQSARKTAKAGRERVRKLKNDYLTSSQRLRKQLEERKQRNRDAAERMRLQVEAQEMTRDYNLGTSLKNYIDPRIYLDWGRRVSYDWKSYYPATLQRKFSWIERGGEES
jgi:DNA topoisomerase-1